jgi:hypothetical protein
MRHIQKTNLEGKNERAKAKKAINKLRAKLSKIPNGPIPNDQHLEVIQLLVEVWDWLEGSDEQSTDTYKLHRAENFAWERPWLTFVLERHGAAKFGSSRAALHHWGVNLDTRSANISKFGWRTLKPVKNPER